LDEATRVQYPSCRLDDISDHMAVAGPGAAEGEGRASGWYRTAAAFLARLAGHWQAADQRSQPEWSVGPHRVGRNLQRLPHQPGERDQLQRLWLHVQQPAQPWPRGICGEPERRVRIWNCDFNGVQGNGIGQYAPSNISVRGCKFTNCYGPFSYTVGESNVSRGLVIQSCIFTGFVRTGIEIAPDVAPGTLIDLLIDSNWFDDVDPGAGSAHSATGPISVVVRNQTNTRITNNFLRKGNRYNPPSGYYGGIEVNSSTNIPVIIGNLLEDFNPAAYTLWEKATSCPGGNRLFNASGPLPNDTVLSSRPADPPNPGRVPYP
jgi:parallel beta helix pectate lyase-like protein